MLLARIKKSDIITQNSVLGEKLMSEYVHKSHNVSVLIYHYVCPAKYRRVVFTKKVDKVLRETCEEISKRYDINFLEIGTDGDHVHFLIQSIPKLSPSQIVKTFKSLTSREIFKQCPEVKEKLWGGELWSDGYFVSTVGKHGSEKQIESYVRNQGKAYTKIHQGQIAMF